MIAFEFATAARIRFTPGAVKEIGPAAAELGRRALVAAGLDPERCRRITGLLSDAGVEAELFAVGGEPTLDLIRAGVEQARRQECDLVIGFGGGSALDTAKAIAALATNTGEILDYLEVVGHGQPLQAAPLPCIAVPSTAGTGSEVTRNAVIGVPEQQVKVSLRSPLMLPRLALVDPELTYSLPPEVTASTGLDALTQLIEPYTSNRPNPMTDALCREGMRRAAWALPRAYHDGQDAEARQEMSVASLFGGLALANAKLGAVHGFAGVLGGMFSAPHGAVCARLLPPVVAQNVAALRLRQPDHPALGRYREVARLLTGRSEAEIEDGLAWLDALVKELNIRALSTYGLKSANFPEVIAKSARASSMQGNPIPLTEDEMRSILENAW
jgi:alcohol dehydrogenase class IV